MKIKAEIKIGKAELTEAIQSYLNVKLGTKVSVSEISTSVDTSVWLVVQADLEKIPPVSYMDR